MADSSEGSAYPRRFTILRMPRMSACRAFGQPHPPSGTSDFAGRPTQQRRSFTGPAPTTRIAQITTPRGACSAHQMTSAALLPAASTITPKEAPLAVEMQPQPAA